MYDVLATGTNPVGISLSGDDDCVTSRIACDKKGVSVTKIA